MTTKFENFQKKCIKWILSEENMHYSTYEVYIQKCREVCFLPLKKRFDFNDLILLYKIIYKLLPIQLPFYLQFFDGNSRLRSCHLDNLSLVSDIRPKSNTNKYYTLQKSFFYRTHLLWNNIPIELRSINQLQKFKSELLKFMWKLVLDDIDNLASDDEWDDGG